MSTKIEQLYLIYKEAPSDINESLFYKALLKFATAVIYKVIKENRPDLAADAASHIFLNLSSFAGGSKFTTWAYEIARTQALMEVRRRQQRREVPLNQELEWLFTTHPTGLFTSTIPNSGDLRSKDRDLLEQVRKALGNGLSMQEIADTLKIHRTTLHRKLQRLAWRLAHHQ
jgi:DNA-directed RNA polymerase specialized sigma24 family protein